MSEEEQKWNCQQCTYENWPKAVKCTICQAAKRSNVISEAAPKEDRDIYKMAPLITDSGSATDPRQTDTSSEADPTNKWSCSVCTFLNWPRSSKCTQCLTPRKRSSPTRGPSPDSASSGWSQQQQQQPGELSPCSETGGGKVNDNNDRNKGWTRSVKWACAACTYENWPKSQKCILCQTARPKETLDNEEGRRRSDHGQLRLSPPGHLNVAINCNLAGGGTRRLSSNRCLETTEIQVSNAIPGVSSQIPNNYLEERRLRQLRRKAREVDWLWLNACVGVVDGNHQPVIQYLSSGGDPARQLTSNEVSVLSRPSAFDVGHTLVHLAIRFQRDDLLALLLSNSAVSRPVAKRVPSDVSRHVAAEIRRHIGSMLKQRKGDFPCYFVTEFVTFALPAEVEDFLPSIQERLFDELLDRDVQKELEEESPIINWSIELTERLGSRLYALWNRSAGDCLLDSALQATWGVFDRENTLRRALGDSLCEAASVLYPRWKEAEALQASMLQFALDESQWQEDWAILLSLATQPGSALEQMHVFTLAHILRRPIIVYGVKYVKSFRGEALGYARFEGIYLPLLWEPSFCWKSPIALGYTRGHFSALVPMEPDSGDVLGAGANIRPNDELQVVFLPLMTSDHQLLPIHFLTQQELGREEEIMREWLDCCVTEGGILVAQQKIPKRTCLVAQMVEEWLDIYRRTVPHNPPSATDAQAYSSDGDSDQE